jgi:hypothetical protein
VTGRSDVVLNLKEKKKSFSFLLDLLRVAAEVLTMCCFFGTAWVRPCCIGMIRVGSYFLDLLSAVVQSFKSALFFDGAVLYLSC